MVVGASFSYDPLLSRLPGYEFEEFKGWVYKTRMPIFNAMEILYEGMEG